MIVQTNNNINLLISCISFALQMKKKWASKDPGT